MAVHTIVPNGNWMNRDSFEFECKENPKENAEIIIKHMFGIDPKKVEYDIVTEYPVCT